MFSRLSPLLSSRPQTHLVERPHPRHRPRPGHRLHRELGGVRGDADRGADGERGGLKKEREGGGGSGRSCECAAGRPKAARGGGGGCRAGISAALATRAAPQSLHHARRAASLPPRPSALTIAEGSVLRDARGRATKGGREWPDEKKKKTLTPFTRQPRATVAMPVKGDADYVPALVDEGKRQRTAVERRPRVRGSPHRLSPPPPLLSSLQASCSA